MKSKKIKKIIIYTLVAMLVSTSVFFSYEKASRVKAAVVVDDAIIIATLLGAMGIVYIGSEWYGSNLAEDWYPDYGEELGEVEDNIINLWDTEVWQLHDQGVITNPPDDFDPDNDDPEENPPTWEKLKQWMRAHPEVSLAIGTTTLLGGVFLSVASSLEKQAEENLYLSEEMKATLSESALQYITDNFKNYPLYTYFVQKNSSKYILLMGNGPFNFEESSSGYSVACTNGGLYVDQFGKSQVFEGSKALSLSKSVFQLKYKNFSIEDTTTIVPFNNFNNNTVRYSPNPRGDEYGNIILPNQEIAPVGQIQLQPLLEALYNANQATDAEQAEQLKQQATDNFISSLENPEPNPEPNPNPNPDSGEDSGTTDPEINSSFLADLSNLFPFCIPFDLIDCIKLLTAERKTPCVEVPMHFKFVDVDYTWVIDLEDFNGVASVCRTMFLLLYIVGLVMVTRPLIRG